MPHCCFIVLLMVTKCHTVKAVNETNSWTAETIKGICVQLELLFVRYWWLWFQDHVCWQHSQLKIVKNKVFSLMKGPSVHWKYTLWPCSYLHREVSNYSQTTTSFIFVSPSWHVTCCHQNRPLTSQQWLSDVFAVASPHDPNKTNSLWLYNKHNWISGVWPL